MAETCPKCGYAGVETDTCPRCRVVVSQYRAHLRRRREKRSAVSAGSRAGIQCPRCATPLTRLETDERIEVHDCQGCGGTWHDEGVLDEFSREAFQPLLQEEPVSREYPSDLQCPRCEVPMEKRTHGAGKVRVDRCRSCRGLWLDAAEPAKAADAAPSPALTCPRCHSSLEERPAPGGIVAQVCGSCEGAWYERCELLFLARRGRALAGLFEHPRRPESRATHRCPKPWCQGLLEDGRIEQGELRGAGCPGCEGTWLDAAGKARLEAIVGRHPPGDGTSCAPDGLVVYHSRARLALLGVLALVFVLLGVGIVRAELRPWSLYNRPDLNLGVLFIAMGGFGLLRVVYRLCWWRPAFSVNRQGIAHNGFLWGTGRMTWADIAGVIVQEWRRHAGLVVRVIYRNPRRRGSTTILWRSTLPTSPGSFVREMSRDCPNTVRILWTPGGPPGRRRAVAATALVLLCPPLFFAQRKRWGSFVINSCLYALCVFLLAFGVYGFNTGLEGAVAMGLPMGILLWLFCLGHAADARFGPFA